MAFGTMIIATSHGFGSRKPEHIHHDYDWIA
jgi:hypothetical protein